MRRWKQLVMLLMSAILLFGSALGPAIDFNDDDTPDNDMPEILFALESGVVPKIDVHSVDMAAAVIPDLTCLALVTNEEQSFGHELLTPDSVITHPPLVLRT